MPVAGNLQLIRSSNQNWSRYHPDISSPIIRQWDFFVVLVSTDLNLCLKAICNQSSTLNAVHNFDQVAQLVKKILKIKNVDGRRRRTINQAYSTSLPCELSAKLS